MADISIYLEKADALKPKSIIDQINYAFYEAGIPSPGTVVFDGKIHRFSTSDKKGDDSGYYIFFNDGFAAGQFGDWRSGEVHNWHEERFQNLTMIESIEFQKKISEAKRQRDEELKKRHEKAAETVASIWEEALPASAGHPYLQKKGVQPHGARVGSDGRLMLPLYNSSGELSSLQYIDATGRKLYHAGGAVGGCFYMMGDAGERDTIYIAEGFATAATICETMQAATVAAYSANNLPPVAETLRKQYPAAELVIVADNDKSKAGENYATQASAKSGARVVLIPNEEQDANDFVQAGGDLVALLGREKTCFFSLDTELLKNPEPIKWIIKGWLPERSTCILHGASGLGKTFTVLDMILSVAYKDSWNGCRIKNHKVAYLAGEGHAGIRWRLRAWRQHHGVEKSGNVYFSNGARTLDTQEGLQFVLSELRALEEPPKIIVVDTVHKHFAGEENSNTEVGAFIRAMDLIRDEFDATVLAIHHSGHGEGSQKRSRGGSAFKDDVDVSIAIYTEGGQTLIEQMKMKDAQKKAPIGIEIEQVIIDGVLDEDGDPVTSAVSKIVEIEQKEETKQSKQSNQSKRDIDDLIRMWRNSGAEVDGENAPILSRSAMKRYAETIENKSPSAADSWLKPSKSTSIVYRLVEAGEIEWLGDGCKIIGERALSRVIR